MFAASPANAAAIISATLDREGAVAELRFRLDGPAPKLQLTSHGNQLWIDIDQTALKIPPRPVDGYEGAPIESVRAFSMFDNHARIVIEVSGKDDYAIAQRTGSIALRIAPAGAVANLGAPLLSHHQLSPPPRSVTTQTTTQSVERAIVRPPAPEVASPTNSTNSMIGNPLVMIDPGHGGYDPGTQSSSGILEKDLTMEVSRRVVYALSGRGVRAQLTRDSDDFISLAERARRANVADADLFVSIHMNSSPNPETTGIEVYYLNNTTDRATIRLARMENSGVTGGSAPSDSNLNYILADLRQNYKATEAASLARMIDAQAVADLDSRLSLNVNALGAKMGPFYVLVGAHMPAVLVECGFMSNSYEAARLSSTDYQEILAQGIATAIVRYLNSDAEVGNL
jgi:N-acetylmuramoyl-L-alanine amidase